MRGTNEAVLLRGEEGQSFNWDCMIVCNTGVKCRRWCMDRVDLGMRGLAGGAYQFNRGLRCV